MSNKKGGYAYLKDRVAKLEEENKMLAEEVRKDAIVYDEQFKKINALKKETIEARSAKDEWCRMYADKLDEITELKNRIDYLLGCVPFWVKWAYARKFGKQ